MTPNHSMDASVYDSLIRISRVGGRQANGTLMSDDQQRESNEHAIRALGGRVGLTFEALNQSGHDIFTGPKWLEALERVKRGESNGVAVAYHDRLGRNTPGAYTYAAALHRAGGVLIVNGRVLDQNDPQDRAMFGMAMVQAELTYDLARQRSLRTLGRVHDRGITNMVPYGYTRNQRADGTLALPGEDPKRLVPDPDAAAVVRRVFEMRANGARWPAVQAWLEAEGIPSPTGKPMWALSTLSTLVRNRQFIGEVTVGERVTTNAHEPLVTRDVFDRAQPRSGVVRTGRNLAGVAGGLLVCGTCGRPLSVGGRGTGRSTFYACRRTSSGGRCPRPVMGEQRPIDDAVDATLRDLAERGVEVEAVRVQRELAEARELLATAEWDRDQFLEGTRGLPATVIERRVAELQGAVNEAQGRFDTAAAAASGAADFPTSAVEWDGLSLEAKRDAARGVIDHVRLAPFEGRSKRESDPADRLTVVWR